MFRIGKRRNTFYITFGDLTQTKVYITLKIDFRGGRDWRGGFGWDLDFGPTYQGTKRGLVACFGIGLLIAHQR